MDEAAEPGAVPPRATYVNYPLDDGPTATPTYAQPGSPPHPGLGGPLVERLVDPPRQVPAAAWLGVASFSFWESFTILITLVSPVALWIFVPILLPFACLVVLGVGVFLRVRRLRRRLHLARWGQVATVTGVAHGFGATSYQNVPLPQAVGWEVTRSSYSGQSHTSTITYMLDEQEGTIELRGRPYAGGVILADPRLPDVALCVSSFPFAMRPDHRGELTVRTGPLALIGVGFTTLVYLGLLAGAVLTLAVFA